MLADVGEDRLVVRAPFAGLALGELEHPDVVPGPPRRVVNELPDLLSPHLVFGGDCIGPHDEHVDVAVGLHLAPGTRAEQGGVRRRRRPLVEPLPEPGQELLGELREGDDVARRQMVTVEAVQLGRADDLDIDDALADQTIERPSNPVRRMTPDQTVETPPGERAVDPSQRDEDVTVEGGRDHLERTMKLHEASALRRVRCTG